MPKHYCLATKPPLQVIQPERPMVITDVLTQFPSWDAGSLEPVWLERFRSVPPYKVIASDRLKTEGQRFLYAKLLRNGTVDPPSVPAKQALIVIQNAVGQRSKK